MSEVPCLPSHRGRLKNPVRWNGHGAGSGVKKEQKEKTLELRLKKLKRGYQCQRRNKTEHRRTIEMKNEMYTEEKHVADVLSEL